MILNQALLDWLTLTSYSAEAHLWSVFSALTPDDVRKAARRMQYQGSEGPHTFWGTGVQAGSEHVMFIASGEMADKAFGIAPGREVRCTRIDLQVTIDLFNNWSSRILYDALADPLAQWKGRRKAVSIVQSGDDLDTIYIGSRKSSLLIRIYVKPDKHGKPAYLRFEAEYKGDKADGVFDSLSRKTHTKESILAFELTRLPVLPFALLTRFLDVLDADPGAPPVKSVEGQNSTIDWLLRQVEPAVIRLLHSHEDGLRMKRILKRWLDNAPGH